MNNIFQYVCECVFFYLIGGKINSKPKCIFTHSLSPPLAIFQHFISFLATPTNACNKATYCDIVIRPLLAILNICIYHKKRERSTTTTAKKWSRKKCHRIVFNVAVVLNAIKSAEIRRVRMCVEVFFLLLRYVQKMERKYISEKLHIELAMKTSASESTVKIKWPLVFAVI